MALRKKRICIDCRSITDRPSGIGEMVSALVRHAPELAPDLDFLLLRSAHCTKRLSTAGNAQEIEIAAAANGPTTLFWLPKLVDLSAVDVFHAPFNILPHGLSMPTMATVHDIMWLENPELCRVNRHFVAERVFYQHGLKHALRSADAIATVSQATADAIALSGRAPKDRIWVTRSGVSDSFRKRSQQTRVFEQLGLHSDQDMCLVVGQNAPYKNHAGAIRAFASAFAVRKNVVLVLVQRRARASSALLEIIAHLGIEKQVFFAGDLEQAELIDLYNAASALLHPSLCEGFGNPVAEAMACGCPVVTSNISAMPEVAGGAAILVSPIDTEQIAKALQQVIDEPEEQARMRTAGLARAKQLCWRTFAEQNVALYRHLLAR